MKGDGFCEGITSDRGWSFGCPFKGKHEVELTGPLGRRIVRLCGTHVRALDRNNGLAVETSFEDYKKAVPDWGGWGYHNFWMKRPEEVKSE